MRDFTLGIIGGCLTHQVGVPKSDLYHQRLKRKLAEDGRVNLKVRIARDFTEDHSVRLEGLLKEYTLDGVLIHVRNYYLGKSVLITKSVTDSEFRYHLHPFLFRPWQTGWSKIEKSNFAGRPVILRRKNTLKKHCETSAPERVEHSEINNVAVGKTDLGARRLFGVSLRDMFFVAGALAGLDSWAVRDELAMLREVMRKCRQLSLPLCVLGPGRRPSHYWLDRVCIKLDKHLTQELRKLSVPYCGISDAVMFGDASVYSSDGWHLSSAGHDYVAGKLYCTMTDGLSAGVSNC